MTRKLCLAVLAAIPAFIHAEDCCMPEYSPGQPLCDPCAGYAQYGGIELNCGWDLYATGEFLYWRPFGSLSWVISEVPQNPFADPFTFLAFKWGYKPGFKIGLGWVAHCFDDWIFNIDYLRYHQSFNNTVRASLPNSLMSTTITLFGDTGLVFASSIKNRAHYHYDIAGVSIQRPNYLGQRVILNPFLGLKWLKRDVMFGQDILDLGGGLNIGKATVKYTSIGISAGFEGSWLFCWGLSLIGNADVAILYPYKRSFFQINTPAVISDANPIQIFDNHIRHLDIYAKGGVGINWGSYFCCNQYHFNLAATFDFMGDIVKLDSLTGSIFGNASVILMGLSIRGQFEF